MDSFRGPNFQRDGSESDFRGPDIVEYRPQLPRRPGSQPTAILYLRSKDGMGLIGFPQHCIDTVRDCINQNLGSDSIRKEFGEKPNHNFKLYGWPWVGANSDSVRIRRMMRDILDRLRLLGWDLCLTTNISEASRGTDSLVFRRNTSTEPVLWQWFTVAFSMTDRLRFIDAPEEIIRDIIPILPGMHEHELHHKDPGIHDFFLNGRPFSQVVQIDPQWNPAPNLILFLHQFLEEHGFSIHASIRQKHGHTDGQGASDTWHVCRPVT